MKKTNYIFLVLLAVTLIIGLFLLQGDSGYAAKEKEVYFSKSVKTITEGNHYIFKVFGKKNDGKAVLWSSSNLKIAKVDKRGKVTAIRNGVTTIIAVIAKSGESISAKLKVVEKPEKKQDLSRNEERETNELVKNLSKEVEKMQNLAWDSIGFLDCKDINNFCYSLFYNVLLEKEENPVISPLSAYLALVLVAEGAQGNTKTEFNTLLGNDRVMDRVHQLTESLSKVSGSTKLSIADSIWMDNDFRADSTWLSRMVNFYNAEIYQADLNTNAARTGINQWVNNKTKGLIPTLLDKNLSKQTRLILMNTIYFKAKWKHVFEKEGTYKREFINENGKKVMTEFMNDNCNQKYFKTENADGIILPYDDDRLSFFAIRPLNGQTARELAQNLTEETVADYLASAKNKEIILHLPKFTVDYSITMNTVLENMGLKDAFNADKADFTGIGKGIGTFDQNLYIDDVLQKVKVKVEEQGTEAVAVTSIIKTAEEMPGEKNPIEIDFKEPFVYIIADTKTPFGEEKKACIPLFLGIITEFL